MKPWTWAAPTPDLRACSGAPSSDSSILVKMSAPPFVFFMAHNFSIMPHLLRLLLPLLLSACRIFFYIDFTWCQDFSLAIMEWLVLHFWAVFAVRRRCGTRLHTCRTGWSFGFTWGAGDLRLRYCTEDSGEKKEEAFHVKQDRHREVRPELKRRLPASGDSFFLSRNPIIDSLSYQWLKLSVIFLDLSVNYL